MLSEEWRKSEVSESAGCVWVRLREGQVQVTRTRGFGGGPDEEGPVNWFTPHEWRAFLQGVRTSSRFDVPADA